MADLNEFAASYLRNTRDVVAAAQRVRHSLGASPEVLEEAVQFLEQAALGGQGGVSAFQAFRFREAEGAEPAVVERGSLAVALTEIEAGNVLIASGQAAREVPLSASHPVGPVQPPPFPSPPTPAGDKPAPSAPTPVPGASPEESLDESIRRLESAAGLFEPEAGGLFAFTEAGQTPPSTPMDADSFGTEAKGTLTQIVSEAAKTVGSVLGEVEKLGLERIGEALGRLGEHMPSLERAGRLIRLGIEKVRAAVEWLANAIGTDLLAKVRGEVIGFWEKLKSGEAAAEVLKALYGTVAAGVEIDQILARDDLLAERMSPGYTELEGVRSTFRADMDIARRMTTAVTVCGGLLAMIPALGSNALIFAASIDALILGVVVVIGRGYTNVGLPLSRTTGVLAITRGLAPSVRTGA
jgi:hypothetical protein